MRNELHVLTFEGSDWYRTTLLTQASIECTPEQPQQQRFEFAGIPLGYRYLDLNIFTPEVVPLEFEPVPLEWVPRVHEDGSMFQWMRFSWSRQIVVRAIGESFPDGTHLVLHGVSPGVRR